MIQVNTYKIISKYLKLLSALIFLCFAYGFSNAQDSPNVFERIRVLEKKETSKNKLTDEEIDELGLLYVQAIEKSNDFQSELSFAEKGLTFAKKVKSFPLIFKAAKAKGDLFYRTQDWSPAISNYNEAMWALDNDQSKFSDNYTSTKKNKNRNKQEPVTYKAVSWNKDKDKFDLHLILAKCYNELNDSGNQLSILGNAQEFAKKLSEADLNKVNEMYVDYHTKKKEYDIAIKFQKQIASFFNKQTDRFKKTNAYEKLADLYAFNNNKELARENYNKAISILDKAKDANDLCRLYKALSKVETSNWWSNSRLKEAKKYCKELDEVQKDSSKEEGVGVKDSLKMENEKDKKKGALTFTLDSLEKKINDLNKRFNEAKKTNNLDKVKNLSKQILALESDKDSTEYELKKLGDIELDNAIKDALITQKKLKEIELTKAIDSLETKMIEADREQKAEDEQRQENETKNNLILAFTFIILALVIVSGLIIGNQFIKSKKDEVEGQKQKHLEETERLKRINAQTEMKALRSQMNPHFIFNALQSIQHFLSKRKSKDASEYLVKFGKLMRMVLEYSRESEVSIQQERDALELYMELESVRQPFSFSFEFDESVNIEDDELPPLILQPFVENAIKHGLKTKKKGGHIKIECKKVNDELIFAVEDNGIGREASKSMQQTTASFKKQSLGMKLTEERLAVLNETKKINAHYRIIDLYDNNNNATGTRVELIIPQTS